MSALAELLAADPVPAADGGAWQQRPWQGVGTVPAGMPDFTEIDELLVSGTVRAPRLRLVEGGREIAIDAYTRAVRLGPSQVDGLCDMPVLLAHLEAGACLQLMHLERVWPALGDLCARLGRERCAPSHAHALLDLGTGGAGDPAALQAAGETVLVQLRGETRWLLRTDGGGVAGARDASSEVRLGEGGRLYLPQGCAYQRLAGDAPQLCLQIEIAPATWLRLFGRLTRCALRALESSLDHRRAAGGDDEPPDIDEAWVDDLFAHGGLDAGRQLLLEDFFRAQWPRRAGALLAALAPERIDAGTRLRRRPEVLCLYRQQPHGVQITFDNKDLQLGSAHERALPRLLATRPYRLGEAAADLDLTATVALAARLVREGLLEVLA